MKIVYVTNAVFPSRAANSVHIMKMCQAFAKQGHEVTLLALEQPAKQEQGIEDLFAFYNVQPLFKVVKLRSFLPGRFASFHMGLKALLLKADVVYSRDILAVMLPALFNKRSVLEVHEGVTRSKLIRGLYGVLQYLPGLRGLVVISERLRSHVEAALPRFRGRVLVAHDAADMFPQDVQPRALEGKGFAVGYMGQLYPGKGMEMIADLAPLCPWATFHVVGGYPQDIEKWQAQLQQVNNVVFHGFQQQSKLPEYLAAFDVVLAPYQNKVQGIGGSNNLADWMSPLKLFEYMAAEKTIVCSDLPVLREILTAEQTALLCPPDAPEAWQQALLRLHEDKALRQKLAQAAKQQFNAHHTWDMRAETIAAFASSSH